MNNFDRFTVIIPEHNRPHHLKRLLEYYLASGIKVIVVDSSVREFCYLDEYVQKIEYQHYPSIGLAEKINHILHLITTPYVLMCANDDFILPDTVQSITAFLDTHEEYNSGQGIYGDFDPLCPSLQLSIRYPHMLNLQIDAETGRERVLHLMGNYFQYYYCVYRTSVFKTIYSSVIEQNRSRINNLCLLECYVSSYPAIDGKHIIIPMLYAIRENALCSAATVTDNIPEVLSKPNYTSEVEAYVELLAAKLSCADQINIDEARGVVRDSINRYMGDYFLNYFSIANKLRRQAKSFLKRMYFMKLYEKFRIGRERKRRLTCPVPDSISGQKEWENIQKYILDYYDICYK